MSTELQYLVYTALLGIFQVLGAAHLSTIQRGFQWNIGNRDQQPSPLTGRAARMDRALKNYLETLPLIIIGVLAVQLGSKNSSTTALGMQLYFWARFFYVPVYVVGIPYVRTGIWGVSLAGLLMVLIPTLS